MAKLHGVVLVGLLAVLLFSGCASWNTNVGQLQLGMDPEKVRDAIGEPFTIRAAKLYSDEEWAEVWEYLPPAFTWNPKTYWVYFENGRVVQWGEPGDFTGSAGTIRDYTPSKGR